MVAVVCILTLGLFCKFYFVGESHPSVKGLLNVIVHEEVGPAILPVEAAYVLL